MLSSADLRRHRFLEWADTVTHPRTRPLTILDVGGTWDYWHEMPWTRLRPVAITLLNLDAPAVPAPFTSVAGDACDLSRFPDQSFDVTFSQSVIGHVGGWAQQQRMARELRRVGRAVYLQTPNHYFPIDWRTLVPGFHFLPASAQAWCFLHLPVGTYAKASTPAIARHLATRIRNLTARELAVLFPKAQLERERIAGFTKSLIIHDGPSA